MVLFQSFTNLVKISHKSIYLASFVIILTALMLLLNIGCGEAVAGLAALGAGAVYFAALSLFRKKLSRKIVFTAYPLD